MFKKTRKYSILTLGVVVSILASSCTTDMEPDSSKVNGMLAKAPEMTAYSGNHTWGISSGTRAITTSQPHSYFKVQDYPLTDNLKQQNPSMYEAMSHAPEAVSEEEWAFVKNYLENHPNEGYIKCDLTDYFIQWAGKSYDNYDAGKDQNGASHSVVGSSQMDYIVLDNEHLRDYNGSWGPIALCENWPLTDPTYHDSYGNVENEKHGHYQFYYIYYNGEWNLYLCFDYTTRKDSGEYVEGDKVFSDWVLKITPADGSQIVPPGGSRDGGDHCDRCGHETHIGMNCGSCILDGAMLDSCAFLVANDSTHWPENGEGDGGNGDANNPGNPGDDNGGGNSGDSSDNAVNTADEVEINLALDRKNHDLLESHLSIHVRKATDVEVFIPVPAQYYCEKDDMEIVLDHAANFVHGGPYSTTYEIGENTVTLYVAFEEDGIYVRTEGITQDVIDYCWEHYRDGVTFEVWNYFNNPETGLPYISMEELKTLLDKSTVRFTEVPSKYVNAFGRDNGKYSADNPDGKDFHVVPDNQSSSFEDPVEGPHYNGSNFNDIYNKK